MNGSRPIDMVLFLDIDNVLNHTAYGDDLYHESYSDSYLALDKSKVNLLKAVYDEYSMLKTVFISDWRFKDDFDGENINPCTLLKANMPWLNVIGNAPKKLSSQHWHEVKWWLDEHSHEAYVILDDLPYPNDFFGLNEHHVKVDCNAGLTKEDVSNVSRLLDEQCCMLQKKSIQSRLRRMNPKHVHLLNGRYECSFSEKQRTSWDGMNTLFSEWHKMSESTKTTTSNASVEVLDQNTGHRMSGMVSLYIHSDLSFCSRYTSTLAVKNEGDSSWQSLAQISSVEVNGILVEEDSKEGKKQR